MAMVNWQATLPTLESAEQLAEKYNYHICPQCYGVSYNVIGPVNETDNFSDNPNFNSI